MNDSDHRFGQRLGAEIAARGGAQVEVGTLISLVRDLLGAETTLFGPLQDLLQRPAFRALLAADSQAARQAGRDALVQDLGVTYQVAVLARLAAVLDGCLGLPSVSVPGIAAPQPMQPPVAVAGLPFQGVPPAGNVSASPAPSASHQAGPLKVLLIALVSILSGVMVMGLAWAVLLLQRQVSLSPGSGQPALPPSPPEQTSPSPPAVQEGGDLWQACRSDQYRPAPPPQAGETWWPVVGPAAALADARSHCRADAFINGSGNVQIASFRDRSIAEGFANALTADSSHPHRFWLGEPSQR